MARDYAATIRMMMAKAESTSSSEEADAIMQKVEALLVKHGLSLLTISTHLSDDPVAVSDPGLHFFQSTAWMGGLYGAIGRYYGCRTYRLRVGGSKTKILINGRESCRATFVAMAPYLIRSVMKAATKGVQSGRWSTVSRARTDIGNALTYRLDCLTAERERTATGSTRAGLNALVPVDVLDTVAQDAFGYEPRKLQRTAPLALSRDGLIAAEQINLVEQLGEIIPEERLLT